MKPLESTQEALDRYIELCSEYCDKAQHIIQEMDDPSPIADMAREVICLANHLAQFEHTLYAAYSAVHNMAEYLFDHPRLLLQLKQTELDILNYIEAIEHHDLQITEDLRDDIQQLDSNIKAANEGRFADIVINSHLKHDPIEWSKEYEAAIDEAEREAYASLTDTPRGMGFCFAYWPAKRAALAKRGIAWRSPQQMNPKVKFD